MFDIAHTVYAHIFYVQHTANVAKFSVFSGRENFLTVCFANIVFGFILKWSSVMGFAGMKFLWHKTVAPYTLDATGHLIMIYTRASIHFKADNKFKQQQNRKRKTKTWYEKRHG